MKLTNLLNEALEDISTENKLYHRTNLLALLSILNTKVLKPHHYDINISNYGNIKKNGANTTEIATARKATFTNIDKGRIDAETLSGGIGGVEIELYKDRIKTLRGVKIKPIAELPSALYTYMQETFQKYMKSKYSFKQVFNKMLKDYHQKKFNKGTANKYFFDLIIKDYKIDPEKTDWDFGNNSENIKIMTTNKFMTWFFKYLSALHYREGEERIQTINSIPLSPKYLKIKILPNAGADVAIYPDLEKLGDLIEKNKELFIIDENYKLLLEALKRKFKINP